LAWAGCPRGFIPLIIGDLNINLDAPQDDRDETIVKQCDAWDLTDMAMQFKQSQKQCVQGIWSWRQQRRTRWISSRPDYVLVEARHRKRFQKVVYRLP